MSLNEVHGRPANGPPHAAQLAPLKSKTKACCGKVKDKFLASKLAQLASELRTVTAEEHLEVFYATGFGPRGLFLSGGYVRPLAKNCVCGTLWRGCKEIMMIRPLIPQISHKIDQISFRKFLKSVLNIA